MGKKKYPELRKKIKAFIESLPEKNLICAECGETLLSYKMIRHNCSNECGYMISLTLDTIYSSYLNGKCQWLEIQ